MSGSNLAPRKIDPEPAKVELASGQSELPRSILFISNEASRTGAPILLLHLIRWILENTSIRCSVLLGHGGPIEDDFRKLVPTWNLRPVTRYVPRRVLRSIPVLRDWLKARKERQLLRKNPWRTPGIHLCKHGGLPNSVAICAAAEGSSGGAHPRTGVDDHQYRSRQIRRNSKEK